MVRTGMAAEIRQVARSLAGADPNNEVSYRQIFKALGANTEAEKARVRSAVSEFVKRGEFVRTSPGLFRFQRVELGKRERPILEKIWRAMRIRNDFTIEEIILRTDASRAHIEKYLKSLLKEGLVARHGKKGQHSRFRVTSRGREHKETPYVIKSLPPDPYQAVREATASLVRVVLLKDLKRPEVRAKALADAELVIKGLKEADDGRR